MQSMNKIHQFPKLRPLGKSEQLSAVSHDLGIFRNVGMSAHYSIRESATTLNLQQIVHAAVAHVIRKHDVLSAIPVEEHSPEAYFVRLPSIDLRRCVSFRSRVRSEAQGEKDPELDEILQEQHNIDFKTNLGALPFWRLMVLQDAEVPYSFTASFILHHGIGDGAAGLVFHKFFREALNIALSSPSTLENGSPMVDISPSTRLLPPLEQLHPLPLPKSAPNFRREGSQGWTGKEIRLPCTSRYQTLYLSSASSAKFAKRCKESRLTVTCGLHAIVAGAFFDALPSTVDALTGIIPINLRPWIDLPRDAANDAIGSFIDAIKVQVCRSHYDVKNEAKMRGFPAARHASEEIHRSLTGNPSPTGEPYTSAAAFKAIPDVSAVIKSMIGTKRDAAFEVSNLGKVVNGRQTDSTARSQVGRMTFSRSAVAFGAAMTTSVVSGADGAVSLGFSWQEGVVEDSLVERVISRFKELVDSDEF